MLSFGDYSKSQNPTLSISLSPMSSKSSLSGSDNQPPHSTESEPKSTHSSFRIDDIIKVKAENSDNSHVMIGSGPFFEFASFLPSTNPLLNKNFFKSSLFNGIISYLN